MIAETKIILPYMLLAMLGMIIHFIKIKVIDDPTLSWTDYWKISRDKSILAFFVSMAAIIMAYEYQQLTSATAILIGYSGDSLLNKWDKKAEELDILDKKPPEVKT